MASSSSEASGSSPSDSNPFRRLFDLLRSPAAQQVPNKVLIWSSLSGLTGVSMAYVQGHSMKLAFYTFGGAAGMTSSVYFFSIFVLSEARQCNDYWNHIAAGSLAFSSVVTRVAGGRRGALAGVIGAGIGLSYYSGGNWLYRYYPLPPPRPDELEILTKTTN